MCECSAVNVNSIFLSNECEQPVSCFVEPCTVANCTSSDDAECYNNYCGGCHADYYYDDEIFICDAPGSMIDLSNVDFGECEMMLGFGWINNHCAQVSGCGLSLTILIMQIICTVHYLTVSALPHLVMRMK